MAGRVDMHLSGAIAAPPELKALRQWVLWRYDDGRKVPYQASGRRASSTARDTWNSFDEVMRQWQRDQQRWAGIGFVFHEDDPFFGVDLDDCLQGSVLRSWAIPIVERFSDTYLEISPSGTGLKAWGRGHLDRAACFTVGDGKVEVYDRSRYFTFTGNRFRDAPLHVADHQDDLGYLLSMAPAGKGRVPFVIDGPIQYGHRHETLVSIGGTLSKRGIQSNELAALFLEMRKRFTGPPVPDASLKNLASALVRRYGGHHV